MIDLPKNCEVNKFIPKKTFYEKVSISSSIKQEFVDKIEKVTWLYKLSEDTVHISKTDEIEEIEIFEILLKEKYNAKNIINLITKSIPYKILFVLKYNNEYCYAIKVENTYYSEWNEDIKFDISGMSLETVYQNFVKTIIKEDNNNKQFENIIEEKSRKDEIEKKIALLESKLKHEKQFNRKVELNEKINKLKKELENE